MNTSIKVDSKIDNRYNIEFKKLISKFGLLIAFIIICTILSVASPNFLNIQNILTILRQISINGILAIGVTYVILTGGIDLSLGSMVALTGVIAATFAHEGSYNAAVPICLGMLAGVVFGLINSLVITKGKVAPFIVTLGMMTIARGLALVISRGRPITNLSKEFKFIGGGDVLGIPVPVLILVLVAIISVIILSNTKIGRYVYAVGGNENAANASGINVNMIKTFVYTVCGALSGLAGVVLASRITAGQPNTGVGYELDAIAAAVIGGTSLLGGIGSIVGTILGALIIGVINNGLDLLNVSSYYQQIIKGIIIICAVLIDRKNSK